MKLDVRIAALVAVGVVVVLGCGGARSPAAAPAKDPVTIEEAQEQIARAQAELSGAAPEKVLPAPSAEEATKATTEDTSAATDWDAERPRDGCTPPCRALASMRRAVAALCRMTGSEDSRCADARRTLATNEAKVGTCHC